MMLPEGWVTDPSLWTGMTVSAARNGQLKTLGNGVVPAQAARAIELLLEDEEEVHLRDALARAIGKKRTRPRQPAVRPRRT